MIDINKLLNEQGHLGWIPFSQRTNSQNDEHEKALAKMPRMALAPFTLNKGEKICLFDKWKDPGVLSDVGFLFPRFHQLTGSCVGAGGGQVLFTTISVQRALNQTKAFIPFWPFDYGMCRYNEGDRGRGEGAMGSSFAKTVLDGILDASDQGLPAFQNNGDGLVLTESLEMAWSDGGSNLVTKWKETAKKTPIKSTVPISNTQDLLTGLANGYAATFACDRYIGKGSVRNGVLLGHWDGQGGHQQSIHAAYNHPDLGLLFWAQNNWPKGTYPTDPMPDDPPCGVWVLEADVTQAYTYGSEVYLFSHLEGPPAPQPGVLDWIM